MECMRPSSDSEAITRLDKLAEYYYIYKLNARADSLLKREVQIADTSNNPNLKFTAYFGNAILSIGNFTSSQSFENIVAFIKEGIAFANSQNNNDYISLGNSRLSYIFRQRGKPDSALIIARMSIETSTYVTDDSLKAVLYMELGNAYADNGEMVDACSNYNKAFDFALDVKSFALQSQVRNNIAEIYNRLNQEDEAMTELKSSLRFDQENNYQYGVMMDYRNLARVTTDSAMIPTYINKAIAEADSLQDESNILALKRLMLAHIYVDENNWSKAINYLHSDSDLDNSYRNVGLSVYYFLIGNIYLYGKQMDSTLKYYKLCEADISNNFDVELSTDLYVEMAAAYQQIKDWPNAKAYLLKVYNIYKEQHDVSLLAGVCESLNNFYSQMGDYKSALKYANEARDFKEKIKERSNTNKIALLAVDRENRQHEQKLKLDEEQENRKRNLQYMIILISICIIFATMLVVGAFSVSKLTIRLLGYFFFISVFEFLVMLIDNHFLSEQVHNEPLKLWIIKIVLIACLVPVQHFLEHNLMKFLQSRKLLEARSRFSFSRTWKNLFKTPEKESIEDDTAVL